MTPTASHTERDASTDRTHRPLGPTAEDLLGQRADHRSQGDVEGVLADGVVTEETPVAELPELETDVYCLEPGGEEPRARREAVLTALDTLALDTALGEGGDVVWIDSQGHAATHVLSRVAPSERALDRVQVARAFTTHQHHTLVSQVARWLQTDSASPFGGPETERPAVVVAPAVDALYRAGELSDDESQRLFTRAVVLLRRIAVEADVPVLTTRATTDEFADPLVRASTTITVEQTRFGPRFESAELAFETLAYPSEDGTVQTTLAFWREVLRARHGTGSATAESTPSETTAAPTAGGW